LSDLWDIVSKQQIEQFKANFEDVEEVTRAQYLMVFLNTFLGDYITQKKLQLEKKQL